MLNLFAFNEEYDKEMLENSYNAIRSKDCLEIVTDESEQKTILNKIAFALKVPENVSPRFQNLFKISDSNGQFYIAQCLFNCGFSASSITRHFTEHRYYFQIVGFAGITIDLGKTIMRPETKTDKIVGRFFGNDIDFNTTKKFSDKYYLVSDKRESVNNFFNKNFADTVARYDHLLLIAEGKEIFITFDDDFEEGHSGMIEDIFSNCNFLINK